MISPDDGCKLFAKYCRRVSRSLFFLPGEVENLSDAESIGSTESSVPKRFLRSCKSVPADKGPTQRRTSIVTAGKRIIKRGARTVANKGTGSNAVARNKGPSAIANKGPAKKVPPNKKVNVAASKKKVEKETSVTSKVASKPEAFGKKVKMKFEIADTGTSKWFPGIISSYNDKSKKYGIFFPCDQETVFTNLNDKDLVLID